MQRLGPVNELFTLPNTNPKRVLQVPENLDPRGRSMVRLELRHSTAAVRWLFQDKQGSADRVSRGYANGILEGLGDEVKLDALPAGTELWMESDTAAAQVAVYSVFAELEEALT